jgi:hypothetical protein
MFQLTRAEFDLIFQNGTSNWGGTRKLHYAFTEHGVAMLAGLLNSEKAVAVNIIRYYHTFSIRTPFLTSNNQDFVRYRKPRVRVDNYDSHISSTNGDTADKRESIRRTL